MSQGQGKLSVGAATVVAINAMIGVGVLAMPAVLSRNVGPASIISFFIGIFAVVCIGLTFGRAAFYWPGEGWNYRYPASWAGHKVGLFSSFAYLIAVTVAMGFLVQQAGIWTNKFIPFFSSGTLSIAIQVILTLLVLAGTTISSVGQYVIVSLVVTPLVVTSIVCWLNFDLAYTTPFMPSGIGAVFAALPTAMFGFFGFESVPSLYSIVENPQHNVPKAFLRAIVIVGTLYLSFVTGIIFSIPAIQFSGGLNDTLATVLQRVFPNYAFIATFVLVGATFGIIGTLHSMIWSLSTLFTDVVSKVKVDKVQTMIATGKWSQSKSVLLISGAMILISIFAPAKWLIDLTSVFMFPCFILSSAALLFVKEEWRSGRNVITLVGLVGGFLILYYALQGALAGL